jgi:hypothetical protein
MRYKIQQLRAGEWTTYTDTDDGIEAARLAITLSDHRSTRVVDEEGEVLALHHGPAVVVPYARSDG